MPINWCLLFFISLSLSSSLIHPFTKDQKPNIDLPGSTSHGLNTTESIPFFMNLSRHKAHGIHEIADIYKKSQNISGHILENGQVIGLESRLLIYSGKDNARFFRSIFATLAIIAVALTPKGIMIYLIWRKSRTKQNNAGHTAQPELKTDIHHEELRELAIGNDPFFLERFQELYPDFTRRLLHEHPTLLKSEFSFCAMIFLNFSSKEIATYTFIQHRSVQTKKSRLRKKMQLPSSADLYEYIQSFVWSITLIIPEIHTVQELLHLKPHCNLFSVMASDSPPVQIQRVSEGWFDKSFSA